MPQSKCLPVRVRESFGPEVAMPTATATTELVKAIERVLLEAGTRITTGMIVDRVAERLTPGIPPVVMGGVILDRAGGLTS